MLCSSFESEFGSSSEMSVIVRCWRTISNFCATMKVGPIVSDAKETADVSGTMMICAG